MISDCTALILAGGDSRRMGQDKAVLLLDGVSLLDRVTATMQQSFGKVIVSVRQPREGVELPQVCDEQMDAGPLAGLVAGMAQVDTRWVFAVACDMPFVTLDVVRGLAAWRGQHQAVVPVIGGHPQPLAAFYATSALETMRASLASGDRSLRSALRRLENFPFDPSIHRASHDTQDERGRVRYVSEAQLRVLDPQLRSFFDLDTPQDMAAAMEK